MLKATVLYGHPEDPATFEKYYAETHMPIAQKIPNVDHVELTIFAAGPDGSKAPYYRMAELYFTDAASMNAALTSAEGQNTVNDLQNFATGGFTFLNGVVQ